MSRRILVTGGAGFIGSHLVREMAADPANEIVILDNLSRGREDAALADLRSRRNVRVTQGDLTHPGALDSLEKGFDEVYHLAAMLGVGIVLERPYDVLRVNALTTLHLLDWMRRGGGSRLLFSSTSEAYAWAVPSSPVPVPTPESVPIAFRDLENARASYALSKVHGEAAVRHACRSSGVEFVIVRYHNVYGPRMGYDHVIPQMHARALRGEDPFRVYSADHKRAFCHVSDAVSLTLALMRHADAIGRVVNVGNDREEVTIRDLAERILAKLGRKPSIAPAIAANDPVTRRCPDMTLARKLVGYEPATSLDRGLDETLAWYTANLQVKP